MYDLFSLDCAFSSYVLLVLLARRTASRIGHTRFLRLSPGVLLPFWSQNLQSSQSVPLGPGFGCMSLKHHLITIFRCLQFSFVPRPGGQQFTPSGCLRCTVRLFPGHSLPKKGICFEFFRPRSASHSLGRCCFCEMRSPPREGTASGKLFSVSSAFIVSVDCVCCVLL